MLIVYSWQHFHVKNFQEEIFIIWDCQHQEVNNDISLWRLNNLYSEAYHAISMA